MLTMLIHSNVTFVAGRARNLSGARRLLIPPPVLKSVVSSRRPRRPRAWSDKALEEFPYPTCLAALYRADKVLRPQPLTKKPPPSSSPLCDSIGANRPAEPSHLSPCVNTVARRTAAMAAASAALARQGRQKALQALVAPRCQVAGKPPETLAEKGIRSTGTTSRALPGASW
jgi:hypothetical protein